MNRLINSDLISSVYHANVNETLTRNKFVPLLREVAVGHTSLSLAEKLAGGLRSKLQQTLQDQLSHVSPEDFFKLIPDAEQENLVQD